MTKNVMMVVLLLLVSQISNAWGQDAGTDDYFKNWNTVMDLLRSKGIEPNNIVWNSSGIEASCTFYKESANADVEYNKCRYNKALDQKQFQLDTTYCKADAEQKYLQYVKPCTSATLQVSPDNGTISPDSQDAQSYKNSYYITCMRNIGWNDPNSWLVGRSSQK
jgi:hypothetical protein